MTVRRITTADATTAGDVLASAFDDDPVWAWALRNAGGNADRLRPFFRASVDVELRDADHLVFLGEDDGSIAIWKDIDKWRGNPVDQVRLVPVSIRTFRSRVVPLLRLLTKMEAAHPTEPHLYLEALGTRSDRQSKGLGSKQIAPMLERADREGLPIYLESSNPENVPFYARHGFVERDLVDLPEGWPVITPMWRTPR